MLTFCVKSESLHIATFPDRFLLFSPDQSKGQGGERCLLLPNFIVSANTSTVKIEREIGLFVSISLLHLLLTCPRSLRKMNCLFSKWTESPRLQSVGVKVATGAALANDANNIPWVAILFDDNS